MQIILAVTPGEGQTASNYHRSLAHVAYRIGPDSSLLRANLLLKTSGGLLCINDREAPVIEHPNALCQAVLRECGRRNYQGVLLDFEAPPQKDRTAFIRQLEQILAPRRIPLYLPEDHVPPSSQSIPLICTAISGGNFKQRLQEAIQHWGNHRRMALDVQRLRMDFRLPAPTGEGDPLSPDAFQRLFQKEKPAVFFSPDLCARYFTYSRNGETHFVLFDDADTLRQKLKLGNSLGFSAAFFIWPEISDIADALFR